MTYTEIECFLAICRYKTGSRAAEALYITQPSLSTRLKTLEKELGGQLFYRKKGSREMTLTAPVDLGQLPTDREVCVDWSSAFSH